jgi:hypothetical protein
MTKTQATFEDKRLSQRDGWKPFTATTQTRTRRNGQGRPDLASIGRRKSLEISSESSSGSAEALSDDSSEEEEEEPVAKKPLKPENTRVLLEIKQLSKVFNQFGCPKCGSTVRMNIRTVCIATSIGFECGRESCQFFFHLEQPSPTTIHKEQGDNFKRTTDYAINVLYVLGFILMGDGLTEARRLLGLLGLPND